jgi:hypothetical protein
VKALLLITLAACSGGKQIDAPNDKPAPKPTPKVETVNPDALCVTKGAAAIGGKIIEPTVRAIVRGSSGDAASMTFTFRGDSPTVRQLASGQARRQLGLKLRAQNGCNLVYVMWRLDPKPMLDISIKHNPGKATHKECGADGYTKIKPTTSTPVPDLEPGATHTLRAEITGDELQAFIDDKLVWSGVLPETARTMSGPSGMRSDNLSFDLVAFSAPPGDSKLPPPKCIVEEGD